MATSLHLRPRIALSRGQCLQRTLIGHQGIRGIERLDAYVARAGLQMGLDAIANLRLGAPGDDGVDKPVDLPANAVPLEVEE